VTRGDLFIVGTVAGSMSVVLATQRILAILEECGGWVSATDITRGLHNNVTADARDRELALMAREGLVEYKTGTPAGSGGRPPTLWRTIRKNYETSLDCAS
jgi:predicted ArsR family transcriptional regulator